MKITVTICSYKQDILKTGCSVFGSESAATATGYLVLVVMVKWMLCFLFDTIHILSTYIVKIGVNFSYV